MTKCDMKYGPINMDESKMKGAPLFDGTDVPLKAFFEYLEAGKSVEKFLNDYPSVSPHPFLFHQSSSFITAPLLKDEGQLLLSGTFHLRSAPFIIRIRGNYETRSSR
jgi:uncharacterized protein (DUF433 family)